MRFSFPLPGRPPSVPDAKLMLFIMMVVLPAGGAYNMLIDRRFVAANTPDLLGWIALTVATGAIGCSGILLFKRFGSSRWPFPNENLANWALFYGAFGVLVALANVLRSLVAPLVLIHQPLPPGLRIALAVNNTVINLLVLIGLEYTAGRRDVQLALQGERRSVMERLAESRSQLVATEDRRRKDLAEFLHGDVQTRLLMAWAQIGQAKDCLGDDRQAALGLLQESRTHLTRVRQATISEVRELLGATDDAPLEEVACAIAERFKAVLPIAFKSQGEAPARSLWAEPGARLAAVRMLEEALQNVLKHARARHVQVRVSRTPKEVLLEVEDDGLGFLPESTAQGVGLGGLARSLTVAGGTFEVRSVPRSGTTVSIRVPTHVPAPATAASRVGA